MILCENIITEMAVENSKIPGWVIWFVGLPGAGKSTYARAVYQLLRSKGEKVEYLSMDERRPVYSTNLEYTSEERVRSYRLFAEEAARMTLSGTNVIMDGTAPECYHALVCPEDCFPVCRDLRQMLS